MNSPVQTELRGKTPVSPIRALIAGLMVLLGVGILAVAMTGSNAANKDFVTYWATGQQLVHHGNPYDGAEILRLEREAGCKETRPYFMRNPPTAFFMAWPLGFMKEWYAALLWSLLLVGSLAASIRMIWTMEGRPEGRLHLIGYMFPPAIECLTLGQVGVFILLGFTAFLYFHKSRPFLAGLSLVLCSIKPHLFVPLGVVLLMWCFQRRAYRVLAGAGAALAGCLLFAQILDPSAWPQYLRMMSDANLGSEPVPTVSLLFRMAIHAQATWLQFVPAAMATVWAVVRYLRRASASDWSWGREGLLLLTVSVMVAPYSWFTDEAVVLPAMLHGIYTLTRKGRSLTPFVCVALLALAEVLMGIPMSTGWYLWTAPAWLGFYLYAERK